MHSTYSFTAAVMDFHLPRVDGTRGARTTRGEADTVTAPTVVPFVGTSGTPVTGSVVDDGSRAALPARA